LHFYRYVYPVVRVLGRVAQGKRLPRDPRSSYEHAMHVNEQTPGSLRSSLVRAGFAPTVWVSGYVRPVLDSGLLHRVVSGLGKRWPLRAIAAFNVFAIARPAARPTSGPA
jgi:hypothetical protein